jgi:hypothetical protein
LNLKELKETFLRCQNVEKYFFYIEKRESILNSKEINFCLDVKVLKNVSFILKSEFILNLKEIKHFLDAKNVEKYFFILKSEFILNLKELKLFLDAKMLKNISFMIEKGESMCKFATQYHWIKVSICSVESGQPF